MRLFIAEFREDGEPLARALPGPCIAFQSGGRITHFVVGDEDVVTWCYPDDEQDDKACEEQFGLLGDFLAKTATVVHAGSSTFEGQMIVDNTLCGLDFFGPVKRLVLADVLCESCFRDALDDLHDNESFHERIRTRPSYRLGNSPFDAVLRGRRASKQGTGR